MSKKLDINKPAKIIKIKLTPEMRGTYLEKSKKILIGTVVEIEKITFIYRNGDIGGKFRVLESENDKLPKDLVLVIRRVTLENIKENEEI